MIHPDDPKRGDWSRRAGLAGFRQRRVPVSRENATTFSGRHHGPATVEKTCGLSRFGRLLCVAIGTVVLAVFSMALAFDEIATQVGGW